MKVKLETNALLPAYAKPGDAGADLCCWQDTFIPANGYASVRTGVSVEIPEGHFGALVGRSGLASRGIFAHYGTIDSGYRGALGVILFNMNPYQFDITAGVRIAQLIIQPYVTAEFEQVESLDETERGEGGFGSTGV